MKNYYEEVKPLEGFDWDSFERATEESPESIKQMEEQYAATMGEVSEGEIVTGTVESISKREVIVDVGFKSLSCIISGVPLQSRLICWRQGRGLC